MSNNYRNDPTIVIKISRRKPHSWIIGLDTHSLGLASRTKILWRAVHVDYVHARGWQVWCETNRSGRSGCSQRSHQAFLPQVICTGVLKGVDSLVDSATPGNTVSSESRPLAVVDTAGTQGLLQRVLVAFLGCPSVTVASREFAIPGHFAHALILHSGDVPCST